MLVSHAPLEKYVDAMLANERRVQGERAAYQRTLWQIAVGVAVAFVLEMQRRLAELNHENARILTAQQQHVSRDEFDGYKEAQDERARGSEKALDLAQGGAQVTERRRGVVTQWQLWAAGAGLALLILVANGRIP